MSPRLPAGGYAVFYASRHLRRGDIVLVAHPKYGKIVKAIAGFDGPNISLNGLSDESLSPGELGQITRDKVLGRLVFDLKPN